MPAGTLPRSRRHVFATTAVVLRALRRARGPVAAATWDVEAQAIPWIALRRSRGVYSCCLHPPTGLDLSLVIRRERGRPVLVLVGAFAAGSVLDAWQAAGVCWSAADLPRPRARTDDEGSPSPRDRSSHRRLHARGRGGHRARDAVAYLVLVLAPVAAGGSPAPRGGRRSCSARRRRGSRRRSGCRILGVRARPRRALSRSRAGVAAVRETSILFAVALVPSRSESRRTACVPRRGRRRRGHAPRRRWLTSEGGAILVSTTFHRLDEMGAPRPFFLREQMSTTYARERTLQEEIAPRSSSAFRRRSPAVELLSPSRFCVYVDHRAASTTRSASA